MRACVQRVSRGRVVVADRVVGEIERGLVVLLGVGQGDTEKDARYMAKKIAGMRVFSDADGKMNLSVCEVKGQVLAISQFTLFGDMKKGRRPSFVAAADSRTGKKLYDQFVADLKDTGLIVETGQFQTDMQVELVNDGPVTILIDSEKNF